MNNMKRSTTLANSRSLNFHSFFKILKTGFQAKTCWVSLLLIANWCVGVPTQQPVSVWYLKNYHYNHKGNLPQKNDDSKPLSLQADQYLLIGSATDRPADAPPLLFYLHHTHNKDNISHYNQEWMNFRLIPVFLFDFVQKIHTITDYGHCQKESWFPPLSLASTSQFWLVSPVSPFDWHAAQVQGQQPARLATPYSQPWQHTRTSPPLQGQWYDIFLKGIWILNLVPPSSIDHIITATSPSVGPGCFPNPARSQLFHWIWHHQLTETDKTPTLHAKMIQKNTFF